MLDVRELEPLEELELLEKLESLEKLEPLEKTRPKATSRTLRSVIREVRLEKSIQKSDKAFASY